MWGGEKVAGKSKNVKTRLEEAFEKLINNEYHKLKCMESAPTREEIQDGEEAYRYIIKREFRERVLLEIKEVAPAQHIKAVKDVIREFYGKSILTDDQDMLIRDYKNYAGAKRERIVQLLREDYSSYSALPGRKILDRAVEMIDETVREKEPISFYKKVNELCEDFIELGLDMEDLDGFLAGVQKDKFLHAVKTLGIYEASKNYISDQRIIDCAMKIKKTISQDLI